MNQYVHKVQVKSEEDGKRSRFIIRSILDALKKHELSIEIYNATTNQRIIRVNNQSGEIPIICDSKRFSEKCMLPGHTIEIMVLGDCSEDIVKDYAVAIGNHLEGEWNLSYRRVLFGR